MKTRSIQSIKKLNAAESVYGKLSGKELVPSNPISKTSPKTLTIHDHLGFFTQKLQFIQNELDNALHHTVGSNSDQLAGSGQDAPTPQTTVKYQLQIISAQIESIGLLAQAIREEIGTPNPA